MSDTLDSSAEMTTVQAMSTSQFIGSIGLASHLDAFGTGDSANYANVVTDMQYLGVNLLRSGAAMDFDGGGGQAYADEVETAMAAGIRFDLVINDDTLSPSYYTSIFDQLEAADPGGIASVEGMNEVHNADLPGAAAFMSGLAAAMAADPLLQGIPLANYTILSYSPVAYTQEGDLDGSDSLGNVHVYSAALPPNTAAVWYVPLNFGGTPGENYIVTETGYNTADGVGANGQANGVNQDVQADYDLDDILDLIRGGASEVYVDELYDLGADPASNEDNFGLFTVSDAPKEAAVALHNLTTILADPGSTAASFTPGTLTYSITGLNSNLDGPALEQAWNFGILTSVVQNSPTYGYALLLAKSNGSFDLAVWQEPEIWDNTSATELSAATIESTITLAQTVASIEVFDPLLGTTPIATYTDTNQVTIGVSDHPIIVEIDPFPGSEPAPTAAPPPIPSLSALAVTPAPIAAVASASPADIITGSGPDTITLVVAEDAYQGDAQFTVTIDGTQYGGVLTTTAQNDLGQQQLFVFEGDFGAGTNSVVVSFLNDAYGGSPSEDRNLYVLGASQNGVDAPSSQLAFLGDYTQGLTVGDPVPGPTVVGAGADTLALTVSEQSFLGDAQFTIDVDGTPIGGTETVTAISALGNSQVFDVEGDFGSGAHTVTVNFLDGSFIAGYPLSVNALYVQAATFDGVAVPDASVSVTTLLAASFTFGEPSSTPSALAPLAASSAAPADSVIGSGTDTLTLALSERAEDSGAQFTISVDGQQIGGVQTTSADTLAGQTQTYNVLGDYGPGSHTVSIDYLDAANSLLDVDTATIDGNTVTSADVTASNNGAVSFSFTEPTSPAASPTVVGTGPDSLDLFVSERAELGGAQFTVSVDGQQIGGVQTTNADTLSGQEQQFDLEGDFSPGGHTVSLDYLNASNSLLLINTATINGTTVNGGSFIMSNNGTSGFSFGTPAAPPPVTLGSGPDTLALSLSEDYFQGNAQFTIAVDGQQVGGVQSAAAINGNGQSQVVDVLGSFSGAHTVSVSLLSGAGGGNNLYVGGAAIDGSAISNSGLALQGSGTGSFTFTH